jgi:hypothetical protein
MDLASAVTFDDEYRREFWSCRTGRRWSGILGEVDQGKTYRNNSWSVSRTPRRLLRADRRALYFGTADGRICHVSEDYRSDDGADIDAIGNPLHGLRREDMEKALSELYAVLKPEIVPASSYAANRHEKRLRKSGRQR